MNRRQRGYTLIELMISLLLGLLLISGFGSLFIQTQKNSAVQHALSYMMEDGRYILEVVGRELRRAASLRNRMTITGNANIVFAADNNVLGSTMSFASGDYIRGQYNAGGFGDTVDLPYNVNRFIVRYQLNNDTELAAADPNSTNSACERSIRLTAGEDPAIENHVVTLYFYVALDSSNIPVLYCRAKRENFSNTANNKTSAAEPLISNVQRLAMLYGIDTDADNAANFYVGENTINAFTSAQWQQVVAVKLFVVLRSEEDNLATSSVRYTIDGATGSPFTASDKRLYRVFSTTIALRNQI